jgi:ribosomal protein S18 acetylase RimI-like enzyme
MTSKDVQKIYKLWMELFPHNPISIGNFNYLLLCNDELDFSFYWLAYEDETIVGVICGALDQESHIAYVHFIGVKKNYRRLGIASSLMENSLREFEKRGAKEVIFSGYPKNYVTPGLDVEKYPEGYSFFEKLGFYPCSRPVSMHICLDTYQPPEINLHEDFSIVPFADEHLAPVLWLCKEHLQPEWVQTVRTGYIRGGYSCNGFVCLDQKANVIGFSFYGMVGDDIKRFGPIGINPNYRGYSLGKALLHACLTAQKDAGYEKCYFLWGDEDSIAKTMYENNGFSVFSTMVVLRKCLKEG